ncbi:MAG: biotin/lipoyl-binding protein [Thermoplasmata archaeon]|nr:biotin/lipoyl-binding protein [Thermoplasmata archaeon]
MRVTLDVDGKATTVEVDVAAGTVRIGDHEYPAKLVADSPTRVELEIDGEKVLVEGWWPGLASPTEPVTVDGERFRVHAQVEPSTGARPGPPQVMPSTAPTAVVGGEGTAIVPPMPGKVVEVRVRDGESVRAGQVLLVLEAMKMRNEVTAPLAGTVRGLTVTAGANVRAHEPMLRIVPG